MSGAIVDSLTANHINKSSIQCKTVCNVCGQSHNTISCDFLCNLHYVSDSPILSRAKQTLPPNLEITRMADKSTTVVSKIPLEEGTTFGPIYAKKIWTINPSITFPIKVFGNAASDTYYLDYSNENYSNWMCFIAPASNSNEQNLVCYQVKKEIFYTAVRKISVGEELKVWYAPYYALKMNMPLFNTDFANFNNSSKVLKIEKGYEINNDQSNVSNFNITQELVKKLPAQRLGAREDKDSWNCKLCSITMYSVVTYAKHLMEHYKPLLGVFCDICSKKFNYISVLERHKRIVHSQNTFSSARTKDKKDILQDCEETQKKISSNTGLILISGKKDLLDTEATSMKNVMQNNRLLMGDSSLKPILDNQCLDLNLGLCPNLDSILSVNNLADNSFHLSSENSQSILIGDMGNDEYLSKKDVNLACDICDKAFDRADYLYRHLRKHTGEFTCTTCLTVFARKENLISHTCNSQKRDCHFECPYCQKTFMQKKYLKRHIARHNGDNKCKWCHQLFNNRFDLKIHECTIPKHECLECDKKFLLKVHLIRHLRSHYEPKPVKKRVKKKKQEDKHVICEKCGDFLKDSYSLKQHLRSHGEKLFECDVCQRKFHRIGVLKQHKSVHQSNEIPCKVCAKKLKSKKALDIHMLLHGSKKHICDKCDKSFFQKCNYLKHYKQVHSEKVIYKCLHCSSQFSNKLNFTRHVETHTKPAEFVCTFCHKSYHKEYQLKRHLQSSHSSVIYRCPFCSMTARHRHSVRRHFERQHHDLKKEWDKIGFINRLIEKSESIKKLEDNVSITEDNFNTGKIKFPNNNEGTLEETSLNTNAINAVVAQSQNKLKDINVNQCDFDRPDGHEILLQISQVQEIEAENLEISFNEVPQITINETDESFSDSVLDHTYIFGEEDGDVMFYVLNETPTTSEY